MEESHYLNVVKTGIGCPTAFLRRHEREKWVNGFKPWIASVLDSNMDLQVVMDHYCCAAYVVDYINKSNRGISNLHRAIVEIRTENTHLDINNLLRWLGVKVPDTVEMSSQEVA